MNYFVLLFFTVFWSYALSSCITPSGHESQCVLIHECQEFVAAFQHQPLPYQIITFMRKSHCGYESMTSKVCCGPLPDVYPNSEDPVDDEDSFPMPRDKCGIATEDKIIGGQATDLDEYPWMALLGYLNNSMVNYACGGVLLNHRYVLSAAHCVIGAIETAIGKLTTVRLGEYDIMQTIDCKGSVCAGPVQDIAVQSAYPHLGFSDANRNRKDDISLIRLAKRAQFTDYVQPICLRSDNPLNEGDEVFVAGWGRTESGSGSPVKLKLSIPIANKTVCAARYSRLKVALTEKHICAGGVKDKDACQGDSGGPLMRNVAGTWETVAVVSFGNGCAKKNWPGIYVSIASYRNWIEDTMRASNAWIKPTSSVGIHRHTMRYPQNHPYRYHYHHNHGHHHYRNHEHNDDHNHDYDYEDIDD